MTTELRDFKPAPRIGVDTDRNPSLLRDPVRFERDVLAPIRAVVGDKGVVTDRAAMQPVMESWRDGWVGRVPLVVQPANTAEMAAVVAVCAATRTPIVPQGGNTSGVTRAGGAAVAVPISKVAAFLAEADAALQARFPGIRSFSFGHVGDGNIHYNPLQASGEPATAWAEHLPGVNRIVHDIVHHLGGSITAEHGIGRLRVGEVARYTPPFEMAMMACIKRSFDPDNIMNPGKVIPADVLDQAP